MSVNTLKLQKVDEIGTVLCKNSASCSSVSCSFILLITLYLINVFTKLPCLQGCQAPGLGGKTATFAGSSLTPRQLVTRENLLPKKDVVGAVLACVVNSIVKKKVCCVGYSVNCNIPNVMRSPKSDIIMLGTSQVPFQPMWRTL